MAKLKRQKRFAKPILTGNKNGKRKTKHECCVRRAC